MTKRFGASRFGRRANCGTQRGDPFWRQVLLKPMIHMAGREIAF